MKTKLRELCVAVAAAATLTGLNATANEPAAGMNMEEMMAMAKAAGSPGPAHKVLEPMVGEWEAEVKMWMTPGGEPSISTATAKSTWAFNGRFVKQEFNGEFMGQPFHGVSFTGFDNVRQKYNSVWMDDMSTTMVSSEGEADLTGKVITFGGTYACALTGEPHKQTKQIYRMIDNDKFVFEMHDPALGENSKTMEITYTRK